MSIGLMVTLLFTLFHDLLKVFTYLSNQVVQNGLTHTVALTEPTLTMNKFIFYNLIYNNITTFTGLIKETITS